MILRSLEVPCRIVAYPRLDGTIRSLAYGVRRTEGEVSYVRGPGTTPDPGA